MGLWAGIKYALNSTLGTDEFKPLDKLIVGEKLFCSSDTVIAQIYSKLSPSVNNYFIPKINGIVTIKSNFRNTYEGQTSSGYLLVYDESGTCVAKSPKYENVGYTPDGSSYYYMDLTVTAGKKYRVTAEQYGTSGRFALYSAFVCAQVTDYNYFNSEAVSN